MEWARLAVFVIATTYLPGRALRSFLPDIHPASQTAFGLALTLILCALPVSIASWVLLLMASSSVVVLILFLRRRSETARTRWRRALPAAVLGIACLSLGPWKDASTPREEGFSYRTGQPVGNRSAGPRPTLAEAALIHARATRAGDPFVSGLPLPRLDPRRSYWSIALMFSGVSPHVLTGRIEPALLLLGILWAGLFALPRASWLFGVLLFGSGFSFILALVPAVRSWQFRIWTFLAESTGLPDLLTEPETPLLLFLLIAAAASPGRATCAIVGLAILLCEPPMALPLLLALLFVAWRGPSNRPIKLTLLALVSVGIAVASPTPFVPLLRALEYARLDYLADIVAQPLASPTNALRTAASILVFLLLSLGVRTFALRSVVSRVTTRGKAEDRALACLIVALLACGFLGLGGSRAWSVGLLLSWAPVATRIDDAVSTLSVRRRLASIALCAAFVFPSSVDYLLHYRRSEVKHVSPTELELAMMLRDRSQPTDPVLHRPNRSTLSLASHVSFRPAVLCYYGRSGNYDDDELVERSLAVRTFFETTNEARAQDIARTYGTGFVIVEKRRPLGFSEPPWLRKIAESENSILYEVN